MISFYRYPAFHPNEVETIFLWPFLPGERDSGHVDTGRFDTWHAIGRTLFVEVDQIEEADFIVYPYEVKTDRQVDLDGFLDAGRLSNQFGVPLVGFRNEDATDLPSVGTGSLFATSYYKSERQPNVFPFLGWSRDFEEYGSLESRLVGKEIWKKPDISYCGYSNAGWKTRLRAELGRLTPKTQGSELRGYMVERLSRSSRVIFNHVRRSSFLGGVAEARSTYVDNMFTSTYGLCVRGAGNFSYRFVELLSAGVIPLFIDTDIELPFSSQIDWNALMPIVSVAEIKNSVEILCSFHEKNRDSLVDIRRKLREVYCEFLRPEVWFRKFLTNYGLLIAHERSNSAQS